MRRRAMDKYIHIRSAKFPILPGEEEQLVNPGMYGKALAEYLRERLNQRGYDGPFVCCEDWGWWVELKGAPFTFGVCIYCDSEGHRDGPLDLFCTDGATAGRCWSWRKLRWVDTAPWSEKLYADLLAIFKADGEVEILNEAADEPCVRRDDEA
jgi:hypothetical protein